MYQRKQTNQRVLHMENGRSIHVSSEAQCVINFQRMKIPFDPIKDVRIECDTKEKSADGINRLMKSNGVSKVALEEFSIDGCDNAKSHKLI